MKNKKMMGGYGKMPRKKKAQTGAVGDHIADLAGNPTAAQLKYKQAKFDDPRLDNYIQERKTVKKGSRRYNELQNKINAAYGVKKRYEVKPETESERVVRTARPKKMATRGPSQLKTKTSQKLQGVNKPAASKPKATKPTASKTTGFFTSKAEKDLAGLKAMGMQESKEVKFDSPTKKEQRQTARAKRKKNKKGMGGYGLKK